MTLCVSGHDVILSTLLIAKQMGIDIDESRSRALSLTHASLVTLGTSNLDGARLQTISGY